MKKELNPIQRKTIEDRHTYRDDYIERQRLEMKRRRGLLNHKRVCLEQELSKVKIALLALDQQMQKDAANKKLINR